MDNLEKISLLRTMIKIRCFEEKVAELKLNGKIHGPVHCTHGQEAIDAGACSALSNDDYIIGNHRSHGFMIAKGASVNLLMAEIFGKSTGFNGGKGGSMHINDAKIGGLGSTGIVGSGLPVACGAAFAAKFKKERRVTCVFFGDGAANEGTFHECLNLAAVWKLPIIFFLINNEVAVTTILKDVSPSLDLYHRGGSYGITSWQIDGQNVEDVFHAVRSAVVSIKEGKGAVLIEAKTCRFHEHQEGKAYALMTETGYRNSKEVEYCRVNKDPIMLYSNKLNSEKIITLNEIDAMHSEEMKKIEQSIEFALESPIPHDTDAFSKVFSGM